MIKFAMAQLNSHIGNMTKNSNIALQACKEAVENKAQVIIFPELFFSGYFTQDLLLEQNFIQNIDRFWQDFKNQTKDLDLYIIMGLPTHDNETPQICYNSAIVVYKGQEIQQHNKNLLPNYSVFDEKRYFTNENRPCTFKIQNTTIDLMICEDIWHEPYHISNSDIMICINASPYVLGKTQVRLDTIKKYKQNAVYVNTIGGQDELVFDGNSFAINQNGDYVQRLASFKELTGYLEWSEQQKEWIHNHALDDANLYNPVLDNPNHEVYEAIVLATKDYIHKINHKKVVIGISGGIDSALVACLAVDALGAENVHGLLMPSEYTADISLIDAKQLCENLNIKYDVIPINNIFESYKHSLKHFEALNKQDNINGEDVTFENIQSRIRGNILMAYSNKLSYLMLGTSNKSEMSVGYCTLYGDTIGAYAPIKDLTKSQVYELSYYYNTNIKNAIPERILTRKPSAELKPNQTDQDTLPAYDVLDNIIKAYVEQRKTPQQIIKEFNIDINIVNKVLKLIKGSEYKRQQSVPGPKLSNRAFGKDWRYSISNEFINKYEENEV